MAQSRSGQQVLHVLFNQIESERGVGVHARYFKVAAALSPAPALWLGMVKVQRKRSGQRHQISLYGAQGHSDALIAQSCVDGGGIHSPWMPGDGAQHRPLPHHCFVHCASYCVVLCDKLCRLIFVLDDLVNFSCKK